MGYCRLVKLSHGLLGFDAGQVSDFSFTATFVVSPFPVFADGS